MTAAGGHSWTTHRAENLYRLSGRTRVRRPRPHVGKCGELRSPAIAYVTGLE